jgi:hypothetical protein
MVISTREGVIAETLSGDPAESRARRDMGIERHAAEEVQLHLAMLVLMLGRRIVAKHINRKAGLLFTFADSRSRGRLSGFHLATGKLPQSRQRDTCRALADEKVVVLFDDGDGDVGQGATHLVEEARLVTGSVSDSENRDIDVCDSIVDGVI